jgi:hypothetical protein
MSKFRLTDINVELETLKGKVIHHSIESISVKMAVPVDLSAYFPEPLSDTKDRIICVKVHFNKITNTYSVDESGIFRKA